MVKRRLKIRPVLVTLNILVLLIIVGFYSFRLVKYYLKENGKKNDGETTLLVDVIIKKQSYVDLTKGLVYDEDEEVYRYIGDIEDNYLLYSGNMYRIVSIDSEYNIKAVSEKSLTNMYSGLEKGYNSSYINKWLNSTDEKNSGVFENNLHNSELLFNTTICDDVIKDITDITCDEENMDNKFGILSLYDYAKSGGKSGYLNNGEDFFLNTLNEENNIYYITSTGEVSSTELTTKMFGVRPVITISGDVSLIKGKGTLKNPYVIEENEINKLNDLYVGDIVEFSDNKFIVIDNSSDNVKVASVESLKDDEGNELLQKFGSSSSSYSSSKNTIGYYLNNEYYKSLKNNDLIVKSKWNTGKLSLDNLDYASIYSDNVSLNIGMLTLGDMYISDVKNVFTILRGIEEDKIIYVINNDGIIYGDFITESYGIRPAFYLKGDISIESGEGTLDSPYKLGVNND